MINQLTIIMYHYVRDVEKTGFAGIKARSVSQFVRQLEYLRDNYNVITSEEFILAIKGEHNLSENSALLTFDDGYIDHYTTVLPLLRQFGFKGIFAPVVQASKGEKVLDVNKIHFILSVTESKIDELIKDIFLLMDEYRNEYNLESNESYYAKLAKPSRFDTADVIFVKRILQRDLPEKLRTIITDKLFRKYVSQDESDFASTLYMNQDQLKEMFDEGMEIIGHSYQHCWLNAIDANQQQNEVRQTRDFIAQITNRKED